AGRSPGVAGTSPPGRPTAPPHPWRPRHRAAHHSPLGHRPPAGDPSPPGAPVPAGEPVAAGEPLAAGAAVPASPPLAGAPVAAGAPAAGLAKRMEVTSEPAGGTSGGAASVLDVLARAVRRRPLAAGASSAPASSAGGGPPASAVFICRELAPLRSSPLGSASFSSVSSIRVFSRQAPGHGGPQRGLRSAQELVARAHREGAGCGRPRSEARCLYLVMCPARARWPRGRPGWPPRVARDVRSGRFGGGTGRFHAEWPLRQPRHQGRGRWGEVGHLAECGQDVVRPYGRHYMPNNHSKYCIPGGLRVSGTPV